MRAPACLGRGFAASDGIVNENLAENIVRMDSNIRSQILLWISDHDGNIHSETYSLLIDTLYQRPKVEKLHQFHTVENLPECVHRKLIGPCVGLK